MRALLVQGVVVEISYIQAVDNKHNLVVYSHHKSNDLNALGAIALKQKKIWARYFYCFGG
jgi:hypothetical protein